MTVTERVTIMDGNGPMKNRAAGPRGLPPLTRFATLRAHAVPMLRRRGLPAPSLPVAAAGPADIPEMVELWQRVAAGRQCAAGRRSTSACRPTIPPPCALLFRAYHDLAGSGCSFFTIGLDVRDPLSSALDGLWAQPTDIHAYVTTARGAYAGPPLDDRPLHHEIALT